MGFVGGVQLLIVLQRCGFNRGYSWCNRSSVVVRRVELRWPGAVEYPGFGATLPQRYHTAFNFRDHSPVDGAIVDQPGHLRRGKVSDQTGGIGAIGEQNRLHRWRMMYSRA